MSKIRDKLFAREYVKTNGNGTRAALRVYDTKNVKTAGVLATRQLKKVSVQEELQKILASEKFNLTHFTNKLLRITTEEPAKGYSGSEIMDAIKTSLKLHGVLTDRKQVTSYNMNINYSELSEHELRQLRSKKLKETDAILDEN